jgi:hypothetical protein
MNCAIGQFDVAAPLAGLRGCGAAGLSAAFIYADGELQDFFRGARV